MGYKIVLILSVILNLMSCSSILGSSRITIDKENIDKWGSVDCKKFYVKNVYECDVDLKLIPPKNECYKLHMISLFKGTELHLLNEIVDIFPSKTDDTKITIYPKLGEKTILSIGYSKTDNSCSYDILSDHAPRLDLDNWSVE